MAYYGQSHLHLDIDKMLHLKCVVWKTASFDNENRRQAGAFVYILLNIDYRYLKLL